MQWREKVDVAGNGQAGIATGCGGAKVQAERWYILTAGVGLAASKVCSRAVATLWRAVVGGRASTAMVVGWGCEGSNALVVRRHCRIGGVRSLSGECVLIR
jgi:hypothetical protein